MASCLVVRNRGVYLGTRVVRLHHTGAQKCVERRLRTALLEPQQAQSGECDVIGRVGLQSARERLLRGVEVIDERFKRPELAFVACAGGVELERLQQVATRRDRAFELVLCSAQRIPGAIVARINHRSASEVRERILRLALAPCGFARGDEHVGGIRVARHCQGLFRLPDAITQQLRAHQLRQQFGIPRSDGQPVPEDRDGAIEVAGDELHFAQRRIDGDVAGAALRSESSSDLAAATSLRSTAASAAVSAGDRDARAQSDGGRT